MPPPTTLQGTRVLLVEDDFHTGPAIARILRELGAEVQNTTTVREALEALHRLPQIVILDVHLPDGSGVEIAEAASRLRPAPHIIATSGNAHPTESFRLARLNVQHYLPKPFGIEELQAAVSSLESPISQLVAASARVVGEVGLIEARDVVRVTMVEEALSQADGNRSQAAKMLGVTRQAVQSAVRD